MSFMTTYKSLDFYGKENSVNKYYDGLVASWRTYNDGDPSSKLSMQNTRKEHVSLGIQNPITNNNNPFSLTHKPPLLVPKIM